MKDLNKIAVLTQARLGSQRVPRKMIEPLYNDKTLMDLVCDKFKTIKVNSNFHNFFLAAHEPELLEYADRYGIGKLPRSAESAFEENNVSRIYEWSSTLLAQGYEYVIMVNACLPFLSANTIEMFLSDFSKSDSEGMFGVIEKKNYYWKEVDGELQMISEWPSDMKIMNTKYVKSTYEAAHALYASRIDIIEDGYWMDNNAPPVPELWIMKENLELFDIDHQWQMDVAKKILSSRV